MPVLLQFMIMDEKEEGFSSGEKFLLVKLYNSNVTTSKRNNKYFNHKQSVTFAIFSKPKVEYLKDTGTRADFQNVIGLSGHCFTLLRKITDMNILEFKFREEGNAGKEYYFLNKEKIFDVISKTEEFKEWKRLFDDKFEDIFEKELNEWFDS